MAGNEGGTGGEVRLLIQLFDKGFQPPHPAPVALLSFTTDTPYDARVIHSITERFNTEMLLTMFGDLMDHNAFDFQETADWKTEFQRDLRHSIALVLQNPGTPLSFQLNDSSDNWDIAQFFCSVSHFTTIEPAGPMPNDAVAPAAAPAPAGILVHAAPEEAGGTGEAPGRRSRNRRSSRRTRRRQKLNGRRS